MIETKIKLLNLRILKLTTSIIFCCLLILYLIITTYKTSKEIKNSLQNVNYEISKQDNEFFIAKKQVTEYQDAENLWNSITHDNDGIKIQQAKIFLEDLQKIYKLSNDMTVELTSAREFPDIFFYGNKILVTTDLKINVKSYTDDIMFAFIDSLEKNFPGYLKAKSITITKLANISKNDIAEAKNGNLKYFIDAELNYEWNDFKISK